jgi:hypothetical protein
MIDYRGPSRRRVLMSGQIVFNQHFSVITCIIRNLSEDGACLEVSSFGIPDCFDLVIDAHHLVKACTVRWRSEHRIGVSFAAKFVAAAEKRDVEPDGVGNLLRQ